MARKYRYFVSKYEDAVAVQMEHGICRFDRSMIYDVHPENTMSAFADNIEKMEPYFMAMDFDMSRFEEVFP